ncbi:protease inhibitor I42 family protein [Patescibacteria group bacterium]|nr:protease inhibitor I42 family protein [Patescibacteria group bacterium]
MQQFPSTLQISTFLAAYFALFTLLIFLFRNLTLYGRKLSAYLKPNVHFALLAALVVWSQYALCLPQGIPYCINLTQGIWAATVALSAVILVEKKKFRLKNMFILGILYSLLIHGAKVSTRYFLYGQYDPVYRTALYILGRFFYGSSLVLGISWIVGSVIRFSQEHRKSGMQKKAFLYIANVVFAGFLLLLCGNIYKNNFMQIPRINESSQTENATDTETKSTVILDGNHTGQQVTLQVGQILEINLPANPSTGYTWELSNNFDGHVLIQVGEAQFQPQSNLIGASGTTTLQFEAVSKGKITLSLIYHRPWETETEPQNTFTSPVIVN